MKSFIAAGIFALYSIVSALKEDVHFHMASRDDSSSAAMADLVQMLSSTDNLTRLAALLQSSPDVLAQIAVSPGPKTILAPTDDAISRLLYQQIDTAGYRSDDVSATLLYHVLNGTFDWTRVEELPLHTVGHSLLTLQKYADLPGGNGQAVIMSKGANSSRSDDFNDSSADVYLGSAPAYIPLLAEDPPLSSGEMTIQPVQGIMSLPRNATETMRIKGASNWRQFVLSSPQMLNLERGSTAFVPVDAAVVAYNTSHPLLNLTHADAHSLVLNHVIDRRAVYSPLLRDQGSLISASGLDMIYDPTSHSIRVGSSNSARIVEYDIIHRGGVIHLIDAVLDSTQTDLVRADQAAESAGLSANSYLTGPESANNSASSQGKNVPPSPASLAGLSLSTDATPAHNSTADTFDVTQSGDQQDAVPGVVSINSPPKGGVMRGHLIETNTPDAFHPSSGAFHSGFSVPVLLLSAAGIATGLMAL